jgi:hypothetical protein
MIPSQNTGAFGIAMNKQGVGGKCLQRGKWVISCSAPSQARFGVKFVYNYGPQSILKLH